MKYYIHNVITQVKQVGRKRINHERSLEFINPHQVASWTEFPQHQLMQSKVEPESI